MSFFPKRGALTPGRKKTPELTSLMAYRVYQEASPSLRSVQEAIKKGRPLIAGFGERFITAPLGGQGLPG